MNEITYIPTNPVIQDLVKIDPQRRDYGRRARESVDGADCGGAFVGIDVGEIVVFHDSPTPRKDLH